MALNYVQLPIQYYPDPTKGRPVFNGSVYIGEPDTDPEILANRKAVKLQQEDGTQIDIATSAQPLLTSSGGVITYNGSYVQVLADGNYSIKVLNKQGSQVYYVPDAASVLFSNLGVEESKVLSDGQTTVTFSNINAELSSFYLVGDNADQGRLMKTTNYSTTTDKIVELVESYPTGTILLGIQADPLATP